MSSLPPTLQSLEGKVAVVTGGSRGIGAQIAYELARRGAKVAVTYTSQSSKPRIQDLQDRVSSLPNGASVESFCADLREPTAPASIIEHVTKIIGPVIDILVNNAGCELFRPAVELTASDFAHVYDLNVRAVVLMTAAVIPHLPPSGGRIINIGSDGGRLGIKDLSLYCSSKAALEALARCHAAELGAKGHTVNTVCPGPVPTDMLNVVPEEVLEEVMKKTPMENRLGNPDDIAQIVGFLAEEGSRWITGQTISATGGKCMW